jgi:autotransporter-associated beta strand protein
LTFHLNQARTINLTGNVTVLGNANWTVIGATSGSETTFSGKLLGSANINYANTNTEASGAGLLRMSGDNSGYSGIFTINGASGARSLRLISAAAGSANATWSVAANNILQVDGVSVQLGTLAGAGTITNSHPANLAMIEVGSGAFSGVISNGITAPIGVTKVGPGTVTLSGASTYTGPTVVNGGTLKTTTAHTGATAVTVADGAVLSVALAAAGTTYNTTSITTGSVSGSTIHLDAAGFGNPTVPMLTTTTFTPAAPTVFNVVGSNLASGVFTLLDYAGQMGGGGFANLSVTLPFRVGGSLIDNTANTRIDLSLNSETPRWKGDIDSNWDINDGVAGGTKNWRTLTSNTATTYFQGVNTDVAIFDDTAVNPVVNLTTTLTPVPGATVNNPTKNYTFIGSGKLSGASSLTKDGAGVLVLANTTAYDHTGGTFINGGVLQIGDGTTPGAGWLPMGNTVNNATLLLNRPDDFTAAGPLSGTGTLVKELPSAVTFENAITFGGPIAINAGTLRFAGGGNLTGVVRGSGALAVQSGTLQLSGSEANTYTGLTTVSGGTLQLNKTAGVNAVAGTILLTGTGALTRMQVNQIDDGATIIYDKGVNGGSLVLNETVGAISMLNGNDTGAQVQANTGFAVTGLLSGTNSSVFAVASNHTASVGGIDLSGNAIVRIAANANPSSLTVGALGITASGGTIQVGQGGASFDAVLNLGGNVTTTGDLAFTDGNFTGIQLRRIDLGVDARTFKIAAGTTTTIAPDLAGAGGVMKSGDGTLVLTPASASTYTGGTVAIAGFLVVDGTLSGTSVVDVSEAATLGGTGTIAPAPGGSVGLFAGGKLGPGRVSTVGTLTAALSGGGALDLEGAIEAPDSHALLFDLETPLFSDKVTVTGGPLRIGAGMLDFGDFSFTPGFSFDPGATYTLFDGDTAIIGALGSQTIGLINGQAFQLQLADANQDLVLVSVPEPGCATLLLGALGVMGFRRRRR